MGRVYRPKYAYTRADGTRVEKQTEAWYIEYGDASCRWIRRKAGTTKEQAQDALRKAEADVLSEKNGLPTRRAGDISLRELSQKYLASLGPRVTRDYSITLKRRLSRVFGASRAVYLRDLTPEAMDRCLAQLGASGLAPRTINYYLKAAKAMLNWAVRTRIILYSPLDCVVPRPEHEKRHVRRALAEDEIARLLAAAKEGPFRRRLRAYQNRPRKDGTYKKVHLPLALHARLAEEGENNVLAYRLMLEVGLRRSEARSATWADVDLEDGTLTTRPQWDGNKNGREETLPLTPGLLDALRAWRTRHPGPDGAPVVKVTDRLLRCFDDDLVAAGLAKRLPVDEEGKPIPQKENGLPVREPARWKVDKRDSAGRVLDLHALRHTFGTRLGRMPGIDPKSVQTLMRHSDPRLTFGIYVHSDKARLKAAVAELPEIGLRPSTEAERSVAVG